MSLPVEYGDNSMYILNKTIYNNCFLKTSNKRKQQQSVIIILSKKKLLYLPRYSSLKPLELF